MSLLQWITSTIAVLALILLLGRAGRWMIQRGTFESGPAAQIGQWRVAPDARVRAVRVFDEVHLLLETRRDTSHLETLPLAEFQKKQAGSADYDQPSIRRLFPRRQRSTARTTRPRPVDGR